MEQQPTPAAQQPKRTEDTQQYGIRLHPKKYYWFAIMLLVIYILICLLTRFVPQGAFERTVIGGTEYLVEGTYAPLAVQTPLPVWRYFTLPFELIAADYTTILFVVVLLMVISGLMYVLDKGNVIRRFVRLILRIFGKRRYLLAAVMITVCTVLASLGLLTADELFGITPFVVAMAIGMGWDSLVGLGLSFLPITMGMLGATTNPWNVVLPQELAGVTPLSGMWLRVIVFAFVLVATLLLVLVYARRVEKDPARSLMYEEDASRRARYAAENVLTIEKRKYPFREMLRDFGKSSLEWLIALPVIILLLSYTFVLEKGQVLDTLVYGITNAISGAPPYAAALLMLALVLAVELFMPGAMVKAVALMPLLLPVSDIVGVSRQTTVLVFMLGDSFPNIIFPSNTYVLIVLGMIGCTYGKWFRWLWRYLLALLVMMVLVILLAIKIGY